MKVLLLTVGRARGPLVEAIADYESRTQRYYQFSSAEVREELARGSADAARVKDREGERLLARAPAGSDLVALHRGGDPWTSGRFARYLADLSLHGRAGTTFLIGGAYGLADGVLTRAAHCLSLSACTLPHDLARLVLVEQLYRAGTINRGEPYHKGPAE